MKRFNLTKQQGISLLEVMLSLAIIAIILVMATRYFGIASSNASVNKATEEIGEIQQGYTRYNLDNGTIQGVSLAMLAADNTYITSQTGQGNNPWGGKYTPDTNNKTLTIDGIPSGEGGTGGPCASLAARFSVTCANGSITVPLIK